MLKNLRLTNIVLVEFSSIVFHNGFNILSGESGSGKSAIMNALNLIAGDRCDASLIRRGTEKGIVEAVFDISQLPEVFNLLDQAGIDLDDKNEIFIRREINSSGKSRAFINNQLAQLSLLRSVSSYLFEIISQHANQKLLSLDYHRDVLDLFGDLNASITLFQNNFNEETATSDLLDKLIKSESQRLREIEVCKIEIEELLEANLKEDEEEELFAEYTLLINADSLLQKVNDLSHVLDNEKVGVLNSLNRHKSTFDQLIQLEPTLKPLALAYENARLELEDVAHTLGIYQGKIEHNPEKAAKINERLNIVNRIKRKYGATVNEVHEFLRNSEIKLVTLENTSHEIQDLQEKLKTLKEKTDHSSHLLTEKRKLMAKKLEIALMQHLKRLNMPKVEFYIEILPQKRNLNGDDRIEFYLTPNVGENRLPLRDCASGGELSRMLLAIQALLAGKKQTPTLIFDEVDANIGGETALVVGEELKKIATKHQVLCITHFPQVAKLAEHHFQIHKEEHNGRTLTHITLLDEAGKKQEIQRMKAEPIDAEISMNRLLSKLALIEKIDDF